MNPTLTSRASRRFVVLRHEGVTDPHFDVMIESSLEGELETWRTDVWPIKIETPLIHLPPHRRKYLDYEGPISNDRGVVRRVEAGTCTVRMDADGRWTVEGRSAQREWTLLLRPLREPEWIGSERMR